MKLTYKGNFNGPLLMDQLLAVFPDWIYVEGDEQRCKLSLQVKPDEGEVTLDVPEGTDPQAIQAVISAHNGTALSASQQAEADRAAKLVALRKPWSEWTAQDQVDFLRVLAEQMGLIPVK
jgi:hypothetical protein